MDTKLKKPTSGGEVLLKKKGRKYFKQLATDGWATRRRKAKQWELQQKKNQKNNIKPVKA